MGAIIFGVVVLALLLLVLQGFTAANPRNLAPVVRYAVDRGPAVVHTGLNEVDLVVAAEWRARTGAVLGGVQATLGMPGFGYGIDYEYGMFKQEIMSGFQREKPDQWKSEGTPFYIERPLDVCLGMRRRNKHCLELRRREIDAFLQHRAEIAAEHFRI